MSCRLQGDTRLLAGEASRAGLGDTVIGTVQPKSFGTEDQSFAPPECYVLTLEHFPKELLEQIDGVIGGQFLLDHGAILDYAGKKLWLKKPPAERAGFRAGGV